MTKHLNISYEEFESIEQLSAAHQKIVLAARNATQKAYAPYSHFCVGAAALLENQEILSGANQENASFPVGICAERVLLSTVSSLFPQTKIKAIAISYFSKTNQSHIPLSPCGMCRQSLLEYENRMQDDIAILLSAQKGKIILLKTCKDLLPLAFSNFIVI